MTVRILRQCRVSILALAFAAPAFAQEEPAPAPPAEEAAPRAAGGIEEIIVTAQKREENINDIGMSIQAASGDQLTELGITDPGQLDKVVTGFNYNVTYYGTPIYTIRGVGFQDTALASGPTVSLYIDQMPLPFSVMAAGATLDLERVEALKGPQGTLFGQNATGGAVNYIANKPSEDFQAGFDASYGRFNTVDLMAYVGGPLTETLGGRFAANVRNSGPWQKSHTRNLSLPPDPYWTANNVSYRFDREHGDQEFYNLRGQLQWTPSDRLAALFTASGFIDKGDSQMPQLFGIAPLNQVNPLRPEIANYPFANKNDRSADWGPCVNIDGGSPADVTGNLDYEGEAENLANRIYDNCEPAERDNTFYSTTLRVDFDVTDDITLTSLTSWSKFDRHATLESDGTIYQDYESFQTGFLKAAFQELRLAGSVRGEGNWVVGANYEWTSTWDSFMQTYGISTAVPTQVFTRLPLGPTNPNSRQSTDTYAFFANLEYPVLDALTVQGGVRYTNQKRDYRGCGSDGGDGTWADISAEIQGLLQYFDWSPADDFSDLAAFFGSPAFNPFDAGPGNCASFGPPPLYRPEPAGFTDELDEDNVSWRVGLNYNVTPDILAYANVSKGYKSGSFPTVASAAFYQLFPAKQEELLAYEVGGKAGLFDGTLQLNGAFFYYDYTDKQVLGAVADLIFGSLPALVNVPESHVIGFELSSIWQPLDGLRIAPSVSYAKSEIDGTFRNFDPFFNTANNGATKDFAGEPFPNAPDWQVNVDTQYEWPIGDWSAFVGANVNYQAETRGFFYDRCNETGIDSVTGRPITCTKDYIGSIPAASRNGPNATDLVINARALLDVRAGVQRGAWRAWAWGRNITDKHYWTASSHVNDVLLRYTGMPATYGVTVSYEYE
ncbi:MAG TPA: TonB-dependent receptor [Myxococcota bacterium]|nr:TonB-dependent receptor [Myxococcota bacterium]